MAATDEMKLLDQWVCSGGDKVPKDVFGALASPTDPTTWDSYQNCKASSFPNVGFVLSKDDQFCIIDLDEPKNDEQAERHKKIIEMFDSYSETSVSGKGVHIIVKGSVPKGVRRDRVEVYSDSRYMITTFRPINKKKIEDRQDILDILFAEMNTTDEVELEQHDATMSDEDLLNMASNAINSEKFLTLCQGDFSAYPSQSEADFALMSMFAFYSRDNEQVKRLFRMSKLGKRKKAEREAYLDTALRKIRAKQPAPVDTEAIREAIEAPPVVVETEITGSGFTYPPGLVGDLARYITTSAIRPVKEVGLVSALSLCAGMWGRAYNVSHAGLNHYMILLAKTGTGKDGAVKGIDRVVGAMRKTLPGVDRFIGPAGFASGQALVRRLDTQPVFVSVLGEFGITLQHICDPRANAAQEALRRTLLDLYMRSGRDNVLRSSTYADSEKNTKIIASPAVTLLGESTPETFYAGIDASHIEQGLIPRFSVVQYHGLRPPPNDNAFFPPDKELIEMLVRIAAVTMQLEQNYQVKDVTLSLEALSLSKEFGSYADDEINKAVTDIPAQLWTRAHLKALKLGALLAIGTNHKAPVIDKKMMEWANSFVKCEVNGVLDNFKVNRYGTGETRQENDLYEVMDAYFKMTIEQRMTYNVPQRLRIENNIVPYGYFRRRLTRRKAFKEDRRGATNAIKALLTALCESEILIQIPKEKAYVDYDAQQMLYVRNPSK